MGVKRAIYNQVSSGDRPEHQQLYTKDGLKELNDDTQLKKLIECEDLERVIFLSHTHTHSLSHSLSLSLTHTHIHTHTYLHTHST